MKLEKTSLKDCFVLEPVIHPDTRGSFYESYNQRKFNELTLTNFNFVQDNVTSSKKNVLRGLHYQKNHPQAKLVSVIVGEIFDVAVDLRKSSETFGKWFGTKLSAENRKQIWVPKGFAHGFLAVSDVALVQYKTTDFYHPEDEKSILWNDPDLKINWPVQGELILSEKDRAAAVFKNSEYFE